jgi:hypothetical protein
MTTTLRLLAACSTVIIDDPGNESTAGGEISGVAGSWTGTAVDTNADCTSGCGAGFVCEMSGVPCSPAYACIPVPDACAATPSCACLTAQGLDYIGCAEDAPGHASVVDDAGGDSPDCP